MIDSKKDHCDITIALIAKRSLFCAKFVSQNILFGHEQMSDLESTRIRKEKIEQSESYLQAEQLALAYVEFYKLLRINPPLQISVVHQTKYFGDEFDDLGESRAFTLSRKYSISDTPQFKEERKESKERPISLNIEGIALDNDIFEQARENFTTQLLKSNAQMIVLGIQNVGKSTILNALLGVPKLLNTSADRETCISWKLKIVNDKKKALNGADMAHGLQMKATYLDHLAVKKNLQLMDMGTFEQLKGAIKEYNKVGIEQRLTNKDYKELSKISITIPQSMLTNGGLFEQFSSEIIKIIDIPGVDDKNFEDKAKCIIKAKRAETLPIFMLSLDSGTADLTEFKQIREIFKGLERTKLPFIFTKLGDCIMNSHSQIISDKGKRITEQEIGKLSLQMVNEHIKRLQNEVLVSLPQARFFIYDPYCDGSDFPDPMPKYYFQKEQEILQIIDEYPTYSKKTKEQKAQWVSVNESIPLIRNFVCTQFEGVIKYNNNLIFRQIILDENGGRTTELGQDDQVILVNWLGELVGNGRPWLFCTLVCQWSHIAISASTRLTVVVRPWAAPNYAPKRLPKAYLAIVWGAYLIATNKQATTVPGQELGLINLSPTRPNRIS